MESNRQTASLRQILVKHASKIVIVLLMVALLGVVVKLTQSALENQKLQEEVKTAHSKIELLKGDIVQAKHDKDIAVQQEKNSCASLITANEERVSAFATQAAKCIPLMKRFGVKY